MLKRLHIWQFEDKEKILIRLNNLFIKKLKNKGVAKLFTKRNYIKLTKILKFCKSRSIPLTELERNIIAYKVGHGSKLICHPRLPIKIDPIFDMVIAHHFFDGYMCRDNKAGYKQVKDRNLRENFKAKLKYILGKIETKASEKEAIFIPRFLAKMFKRIYNIHSFGSFANRIPDSIKNKDRFYKIAILAAAIGDEGNIDSGEIIIYSANKDLLSGLSEIAEALNYKYKFVTRKDRVYELHILSLTKFYKDFCRLKNKYPFLTLGDKENWLKFYANKNGRQWWRRKAGETKQLIINLLSKQHMKLKDLEASLNIDRSRVRRHLQHLISWGIIKNNRGIWSVVGKDVESALKKIYNKTHRQFIKLHQKKKLSYQKIIRVIKEGYEITSEIASKVGLSKGTVEKYLRNLEKEKKVRNVGRRIIGYAVFNVWRVF